MAAVAFQDEWLVPDPALIGSFQYLLTSPVSNIDRFTILLKRQEEGLLIYLVNEAGLSPRLALEVQKLVGTVAYKDMADFNIRDAMVVYYTIVKVLKKKMPLDITIPPVIMAAQNTSKSKDATVNQAKSFMRFLQRTAYLPTLA